MTIGIVTALAWEYQLLQKHLPASPNTRLILSGMGPDNTTAAVAKLLHEPLAGLISIGCCAGLQADLCSGDIILPQYIIGDHGRRLASNASWRQQLLTSLQQVISPPGVEQRQPARQIHSGDLVSVRLPIAKPRQKCALSAQSMAVAADMESFSCASLAAAADIPFVAVRVVLDDCQQPLPMAVICACNSFGVANILKIAMASSRQPALIRELWHLAHSRRRASSSMRLIAEILLDDQRIADIANINCCSVT